MSGENRMPYMDKYGVQYDQILSVSPESYAHVDEIEKAGEVVLDKDDIAEEYMHFLTVSVLEPRLDYSTPMGSPSKYHNAEEHRNLTRGQIIIMGKENMDSFKKTYASYQTLSLYRDFGVELVSKADAEKSIKVLQENKYGNDQ